MSRRYRSDSIRVSLSVLIPIWVLAIAIAFSVSDCGNGVGDGVAVPRRTAYPRISLYDTVYTEVDRLPVVFEVNSGATVSRASREGETDDNWINVKYDRYGATLHCTYMPVSAATVGDVMSNRIERMSLNVGDLTTDITSISTPAGIAGTVLMTPAAKVTPVQFLATDSATFVLTGALYFDRTISAIDSVKPILESVRGDVVYAMKKLRRR